MESLHKIAGTYYRTSDETFGRVYTAMEQVVKSSGDAVMYCAMDVMLGLENIVNGYMLGDVAGYGELRENMKAVLTKYLSGAYRDKDFAHKMQEFAPAVQTLEEYYKNYLPDVGDFQLIDEPRLIVTARHTTQDMSLRNVDRAESKKLFSELCKGSIIEFHGFKCMPVTVEDVQDDMVSLRWMDGIKDVVLDGEEVSLGSYAIDNPYLSGEYMDVVAKVECYSAHSRVYAMLDDVIALEDDKDIAPQALELEKRRAHAIMDKFIDSGNIGIYPLKALYSSCKDWSLGEITDIDRFREVMNRGIAQGSLASDDVFGWIWMKSIAECYDYRELLPGAEAMALLNRAAAAGIEEAVEIKNSLQAE